MRAAILLATLVIGAACLIIGCAMSVSTQDPKPPPGLWAVFTVLGGLLCGAVLLIGTER